MDSIYELDEKGAISLIKNSIKIDAYASPVIEYEGVALCVFCKQPIKSKSIEDKWVTRCDCDKAQDFSSTRSILLQEYQEAKAKLDLIDSEIKEKSIGVFKEIYQERDEHKKVILDKNNSLIMNIKTLKNED